MPKAKGKTGENRVRLGVGGGGVIGEGWGQ